MHGSMRRREATPDQSAMPRGPPEASRRPCGPAVSAWLLLSLPAEPKEQSSKMSPNSWPDLRLRLRRVPRIRLSRRGSQLSRRWRHPRIRISARSGLRSSLPGGRRTREFAHPVSWTPSVTSTFKGAPCHAASHCCGINGRLGCPSPAETGRPWCHRTGVGPTLRRRCSLRWPPATSR